MKYTKNELIITKIFFSGAKIKGGGVKKMTLNQTQPNFVYIISGLPEDEKCKN